MLRCWIWFGSPPHHEETWLLSMPLSLSGISQGLWSDACRQTTKRNSKCYCAYRVPHFLAVPSCVLPIRKGTNGWTEHTIQVNLQESPRHALHSTEHVTLDLSGTCPPKQSTRGDFEVTGGLIGR